MSSDYMTLVWKADLPRPEKLVCLAIADHVNRAGQGCYASYERLAYKTGYESRQVIRIVERLAEAGIIVFRGEHPEYGTNIWDINKSKLPQLPEFKSWQKAKKKSGKSAAGQPPPPVCAGPTEQSNASAGSQEVRASEATSAAPDVMSSTDTPVPGVVTSPGAAGVKTSTDSDSDNQQINHTYNQTGGTPPSALDPGWNLAAKPRAPDVEPASAKARFRPQTDLQRKITHQCNALTLSDYHQGTLTRPVLATWGKTTTQAYPSPEEEWAKYPAWFAEYVELCALLIRTGSGRPPSREQLISTMRRYDRYNTGWLDFKMRKRRIEPEPGRYHSVIGEGVVDGNALFDAIIAAEREQRNAHERP